MKNNSIPKWILVVSALMCLLGIFVGCSLYFSPGAFIQDVDFSSSGTRYLAYMWGARQITLGSIIGYSALKRSVPMLQISLAAYSVMNVQDFVIGALRGDHGLMIGATVFAFGPAFMVFRLARVRA
ncbi:MAG: hypothetical protein ACXVCH_11400 [Bdellovibrionota bacterium]